MEAGILKGTKKILGLPADYTAFDHDILTHINAAFSTLSQLGVGPSGGVFIENEERDWDVLTLPDDQLAMVKSYIYLKVRLAFDPPATSFHIEAIRKQIDELEWRLREFREAALPVLVVVVEEEVL